MNVDGIWDQIEAFWKLRDMSRLKQLPSGANSKDLEALKKLFPSYQVVENEIVTSV